jgi:hypothetical protein
MNKTIVGLTEEVTIYGSRRKRKIIARIDTGATRSSIDQHLAKKLELGPERKKTIVKTAHGIGERPVIKERVKIHGRIIKAFFTVADRSHMKYKVLIGQNILKRRFLVDPSK